MAQSKFGVFQVFPFSKSWIFPITVKVDQRDSDLHFPMAFCSCCDKWYSHHCESWPEGVTSYAFLKLFLCFSHFPMGFPMVLSCFNGFPRLFLWFSAVPTAFRFWAPGVPPSSASLLGPARLPGHLLAVWQLRSHLGENEFVLLGRMI